jgi:hypothetical protein
MIKDFMPTNCPRKLRYKTRAEASEICAGHRMFFIVMVRGGVNIRQYDWNNELCKHEAGQFIKPIGNPHEHLLRLRMEEIING